MKLTGVNLSKSWLPAVHQSMDPFLFIGMHVVMKVILCYKTQVNTHFVWLVIFTKLNQNNAQYSVHSFCTRPNTKLAYFQSNYLFLSSYVTSARLTTENWNVLDLAEIFHQTALWWAGHSAEDQDSELYTNATNVPEKDLENLIFQVKIRQNGVNRCSTM